MPQRNRITRRTFLSHTAMSVGGMALFGCADLHRKASEVSSQPASSDRPNIIIILADDLGWGDLSCYPQELDRDGVALDTPNLDRLAAGAVRCTDAYATSCVCAPSRAGLMTGRYQQHFGYYAFEEVVPGLPRDETTLGEMLKQQGYKTALFGKWHTSWSVANGPLARGFDRFFGFLGGQHDYFDPRNGSPWRGVAHSMDSYMWDQDREIKDDSMAYLTDEITMRAVDFIHQQADSRNPFLLYLPYNAPHPPLQAKWEKLKKYYPYKDKKGFSERDLARAMIDSLDEGIGRIMEELKKTGLEKKTIVFFSSDNGGVDHGRGSNVLVNHNGGLYPKKGFLWEGGIRVPMIVSWPGHLPSNVVYSKPVSHLDIYATAAALSGADVSERQLDGVNLLPYLSGEKSGSPHEALYWGFRPEHNRFAVRRGRWKLIREDIGFRPPNAKEYNRDRELALFDLKADPNESRNLVDQHPELVQELMSLKDQFYSKAKPSLLTPELDLESRRVWDLYYKQYPNLEELRLDGHPGVWR